MSDEAVSKEESWYADGLTFTCTQCGNCCTGPSGYVLHSPEEQKAMADYLGMDELEFRKQYTRNLGRQRSLNEVRTRHGYDCIFLKRDPETDQGRCSIYPVRPMQCRTWPFWPENLKSFRSYVDATKRCPGTRKGLEGEGQFFPIEKIRVMRNATPI